MKEVKIGNQIWMAENLNVDKFRNGDPIPHAKTIDEWIKAGRMKIPAWCYYNNNPSNGKLYGKLYNWHAVSDPRGLAPKGWNIPSDEDWTNLTDYLGVTDAGEKLKTTFGWEGPREGTDIVGFSALPGGSRDTNGFDYLGGSGAWWSSTEGSANNALCRDLDCYSNVVSWNSNFKGNGLSVRCLKD